MPDTPLDFKAFQAAVDANWISSKLSTRGLEPDFLEIWNVASNFHVTLPRDVAKLFAILLNQLLRVTFHWLGAGRLTVTPPREAPGPLPGDGTGAFIFIPADGKNTIASLRFRDDGSGGTIRLEETHVSWDYLDADTTAANEAVFRSIRNSIRNKTQTIRKRCAKCSDGKHIASKSQN